MSENEQLAQFEHELTMLVERFRFEYELPYASVVGALHMKAFQLCHEAEQLDEE